MLRSNERLPTALLLGLMLLASGCTTKPASSLPPSVAPARTPPLPLEARQPPAPQWCSPTCSHGLMLERESWRQRMTAPE
ncbi:putative secreted protein [Pseudomonas sp. CCOS 191]|nr:putative secreted protein [Pseudomonas sp. CCOS 191]